MDDNYKQLPLKEKELYEYGAVVSMEDETGYYNINGVFGGIEENLNISKEKYNGIKQKIYNMSKDELLNQIENEILV